MSTFSDDGSRRLADLLASCPMTRRLRDIRRPLVVAALGLAVAMLVCGVARELERRTEIRRLEYASTETFDDIIDSAQSDMESTQSIGEHLGVTGVVTRQDFRALAAPALARHPTIQTIAWLPRRPADTIPVLYAEPMAANEALLGFNMASEPTRRAALVAAAAAGDTKATPRVALIPDHGNRSGFLTFTPVYRPGSAPATDEERDKALIGFVMGAYRVGDLVTGIMTATGRAHLDIHVFDLSAAEGRQQLYPEEGNERPADLQSRPHGERQLRVGGRKWLLVSTPAADYGEEGWRASWVALVAGLGLTGLGAAVAQGAASRKRARDSAAQAVRQERDFTRSVIDSLPGAFYVIGAEGRFELWNSGLEAMSGYTASEIAGMDPFTCIAPADQSRFRDGIAEVFARGSTELEATLIPKAGDGIPCYFSGQRMECEDGVKLIGMGIDISARHQAERAMEDKARELARSNADLEQFAYVASHDLREPLRMVNAYVGLLERRFAPLFDADGREFIGFAKEGAARMDRLILDLLEYSRIGRKPRPTAMVALAKAVDEAIRNLGPKIAETGASVTVADTLPPIIGDTGDLARLFQNLIGNALKYAAPDRPPAVTVTARRQAQSWVISVADNGIGISPEYFERIFMIFQRLHTRQAYDGTGIGLAICRKIVEHHGGMLWVESEPGQGSVFHITLPAAEGE